MTPWQWIAAIGGGMAAILLPIRLWREAVTHWSSLREWLGRRRLRREKLDELIKNNGQSCQESCTRYAGEIKEICDILGEIKDDLGEIKGQIDKQDEEIAKSREERKTHSKLFLKLFDDLVEHGFDGSISESRDDLRNQLIEMSH